MKHFIIIPIIGIASILFSGCSSVSVKSLEYEVFEKNAEKLDYYKKLGDEAYEKGYIKDAIEAYEKVNHFREEKVYSDEYLAQLTAEAQKKAAEHYKEALEFMKKDKMLAFNPLEKMIHNYPSKEAEKFFQSYTQNREIMDFILQKEYDVRVALEKNNQTAKSTVALNDALKQLIKYNEHSGLIVKAQKVVDTQYNQQLENAINSYRNKNYMEAENNFKLLAMIDPKDETISSYLRFISEKNKFDNAVRLYKQRKYDEAKEAFQTLLSIYPGNRVVQQYIQLIDNRDKMDQADIADILVSIEENTDTFEPVKAEEENKKIETVAAAPKKVYKDINTLLKQAINDYGNQQLDKAKKLFEEILSYEPAHSIALTYLKKIKHQLDTIRSLR